MVLTLTLPTPEQRELQRELLAPAWHWWYRTGLQVEQATWTLSYRFHVVTRNEKSRRPLGIVPSFPEYPWGVPIPVWIIARTGSVS